MSTQELVQFDELRAKITMFLEPTGLIKVSDAPTNLAASNALRTVKEMQKTLEARRKEVTAPLLERKRAIDNYCDEINAPLVAAETHIKSVQRVFAIAEQKRINDEFIRIQNEQVKLEYEERKLREAVEAEAKAERERQEAAQRKAADELRIALEKKHKEDQDALRSFGCDPEAERKSAEAEAKELRDRLENERLAAAKRAEEQRQAESARMDREAKERQAYALKRERELEASKPKNTVSVKKFRLIDIKIVPAEYLLLNETAVRRAMYAGVAVAGVEFYSETDVRTR